MTGAVAPRLSIVVVNWNTKALLLRLLGQLLPAGGAPVACEVLVVDNASGDGSAAAAAAAFPAATVLPQTVNGGFAFGVNRGLEVARGDWVLLLNTDTEVEWRAIAALLDAAERHPEAAVFGPRITDEHGATQRSTWVAQRPWHLAADAVGAHALHEAAEPTAAGPVDCVSGCVFLIRGSVLPAVGGFDERFFMYFEEADFCERVRRAGHAVRYEPAASFVHVGGLSAGQAAKRTFVAFRESCLLYHAAWRGRAATEFARALLLASSLLRAALLGLAAPFSRRRATRARLHAAAVRFLASPGLVARLCARPRQVPQLPACQGASDQKGRLILR